MRAKFVYEKFTDESDPIHDMGIGKIRFRDIYDELKPPDVKEKWEMFVYNLKDKIITGKMAPILGTAGYQGGGISATISVQQFPELRILIKYAKPSFVEGNIMVKDLQNHDYLLLGDEKYLIEDAR